MAMASPAGLPLSRHAVLDLVRQGERTVNTLAARLRISDNAVRLQLAALERDGLVTRIGIVRSGTVGQPAAEYDITPVGELALSAAYAPAFTAVVAAAAERLDARSRKALFAEAGRKVASTMNAQDSGSLQERAEHCASLINSLGGSATISTGRGSATLLGAGCPLAAAVRADPAMCYLIEGLLEAHTGVAAEQQCTHGDRPSCRFKLTSDRTTR